MSAFLTDPRLLPLAGLGLLALTKFKDGSRARLLPTRPQISDSFTVAFTGKKKQTAVVSVPSRSARALAEKKREAKMAAVPPDAFYGWRLTFPDLKEIWINLRTGHPDLLPNIEYYANGAIYRVSFQVTP